MQLLGMISCAALVVSCKQAPSVEMEAEYAVLQVQPSDKVISTTYFGDNPWAAGYRHLSASIRVYN